MSCETPLVLSKYERVQIVASRVEQLLAGAPCLVDDLGTDDIMALAEEEVSRRLLPIRVARMLPNNKVRIYDLKDFIDPSAPAAMPTIMSCHSRGRVREDEHGDDVVPHGKQGKQGTHGAHGTHDEPLETHGKRTRLDQEQEKEADEFDQL